MIDSMARNDVLSELGEISKHFESCTKGTYGSTREMFHRWMNAADWAAAYLNDAAPTMGGWISVKDRLPERKETVIVSLVNELDGHRMKRPQTGYPADDTGDMWFIVPWGEWATDADFKVTHWMPLPEPPKEEH